MHDIRLIREDPAGFDAALARRGLSPVSQELLALDESRRAKIAAAEAWIASYVGAPLADLGNPIPAPILEAVRQLAGHLFEEREGDGDGVPLDTLRLLSPYRSWSF